MARPTVESISHIVGGIYEAAYKYAPWQNPISGIQHLFGGSRACIVRVQEDCLSAVASIDEDGLSSTESFQAHIRDPWMQTVRIRPKAVAASHAALSDIEAFEHCDLYRDWYRPRDMYDCMVCKLHDGLASSFFFSIHRSRRSDLFEPGEVALLQSLVPHLVRAGELATALRNHRLFAPARADPALGIVLLDGDRRIVTFNQAADVLLSSPGVPLTARGGQFAALDPALDHPLRRLVESACSLASGVFPGTGGAMAVGSLEAGSRIVLSVAPHADPDTYGFDARRRAVVMMRPVGIGVPQGFDRHVQLAFGLTPAETVLVRSLLSGLSLRQASDAAGITFKSGRTYLERIFAKTDTRQQSQLVALLASSRPLP